LRQSHELPKERNRGFHGLTQIFQIKEKTL